MRSAHTQNLATPFGEMKLVVWEESMFVTAGKHDEPGPIVINGVQYSCRLDMRLEEDEWKQTFFSSERADDWNRHMSPSARDKFFAEVPSLMIAWAVKNERIFRQLQAEADVEKIDGLTKKVERLEQDLAEAKAELERESSKHALT